MPGKVKNTSGQGGNHKRPQTMSDLSPLTPTGSVEYILVSGLSSVVPTSEVEKRITELEQDKRRHTATYKRVVTAYLKAELASRSENSETEVQ